MWSLQAVLQGQWCLQVVWLERQPVVSPLVHLPVALQSQLLEG